MKLDDTFWLTSSLWEGRRHSASSGDCKFSLGSQTWSFYSNTASNSLQFSLEVGVLPSNDLETGLCQSCKHPMVESCRFKLRVSYDVYDGFTQVEIAYLAAVSHLDKLVQPSYAICTQFKPLPRGVIYLTAGCSFSLVMTCAINLETRLLCIS